MPKAQASLFTRDDTFFGVCEGLGEDLGINPLFLRLAIPPLLFVYPVATIGGYAIAGLVVLLSRMLFPSPRAAAAQVVDDAAAPPAVPVAARGTETAAAPDMARLAA